MALAVAGAYRLGEYLGGMGPGSETAEAVAPTQKTSPRFEGLQVTGAVTPARPAGVQRRPRVQPATPGPKAEARKHHHLVVAIYQVRDEQRAKRALEAFRSAGFTGLARDKVDGYYRLVSPYFGSVSQGKAVEYRGRILRVGKKLNAQYKLGSKSNFSDCYWETVK